jgi:hypothetical protein
MKRAAALFMWFLLAGADPASGEIIFRDDFSKGLDKWVVGENVAIDSTAGVNGSAAVRIRYMGSGTSPHVLTRSIPGEHEELFIRFDFKIEGFPSGGAKFLKVGAHRSDKNYANTTWAIDQKSGSLREVSFGAGRLVNDTQETINYGGKLKGNTGPIRILHAGGPYRIPEGKWQRFEVHVKFNSDDRRDGVYRVWINDRLILHAENIVNRNNRNPRHINQLLLGNYCQPSWSNPWELYYDNIVVATARVGDDTSKRKGPPKSSDGD